MKKAFALLLAILLVVSQSACGRKSTAAASNISSSVSRETAPGESLGQNETEEMLNQEVDWEYEQKVDQGLNDPAYGLDLSAYDDHGAWSSERMWVQKTENFWDSVKIYYGYIDTEGNLVGQWHEKGGIDEAELDAFEEDPSALSQWTKPGDFQGNYAVVNCGDCTEVIDLQGNTVVKYAYYSVSSFEPKVFQIEDDLQVHFYYPRVDRDRLYMLVIESGQANAVPVTTNAWPYTPKSIKRIDGIFTYHEYNSVVDESFFFLLDEDGQLLAEGSLPGYEVIRVQPLADGRGAEVVFIGADGNQWCVDVDVEGTWLGEPEAY